MKEIGKILTNELKKLKSLLASLLFIGILLPNEAGDIVITEFFFKSGGDLPDYIEIYNATDSHLDLNGWVLEVDDALPINSSFLLASGSYVIFTGSRGYYSDANGNIYLAENDPRRSPDHDDYEEGWENALILPNCYWLDFKLSTSSDLIRVSDPNGTIIDEINYNSSFPVGSANTGHAAEMKYDPNSSTTHNINDAAESWGRSFHISSYLFYYIFEDGEQIWYQENGSPAESNFTPVNFKVSSADDQSFTLSWEDAFEEYGVESFILYKDNISLDTLLVSTMQYTDSGLAQAVTFSYKVTAVNSEESSPSPLLNLAIPNADAGGNQNFNLEPGETFANVTLNGDYDDPESDEVFFQWWENNSVFSFNQTLDTTLTHGTYNYIFKVIDSHGAYDEDNLTINVVAALIADASLTQTSWELFHDGTPGDELDVTLDAGESESNVNDIVSYYWEITGDTIASVQSTLPQTTINLPEGEYHAKLIITDSQNYTAEDEVDISVSEPNFPPVVVLTTDSTTLYIQNNTGVPGNGTNVFLINYWQEEDDNCPEECSSETTVCGTCDPEDDEYSTAIWLDENGDVIQNGVIFLIAGEYNFDLTVTDSYNDTGLATLHLTMFEMNDFPVIQEITDQDVFEDIEVFMSAQVTDENNCQNNPDDICTEENLLNEDNPVPFQWTTDNGDIVLSSTNTLETSFNSPSISSNNESQVINFIFTVTDPFLDSDSDTISVIVYNRNQPPEVTVLETITKIEEDTLTLMIDGFNIILFDQNHLHPTEPTDTSIVAEVNDPDNDAEFSFVIPEDGDNYEVVEVNSSEFQIQTLSGSYESISIPIQISDDISSPISGSVSDSLSSMVEIIVDILPVNAQPEVVINETPCIDESPDDNNCIIFEDYGILHISGIQIDDDDVADPNQDTEIFEIRISCNHGTFNLESAFSLTNCSQVNLDGTIIEVDCNSITSDYFTNLIIENEIYLINNAISSLYYQPDTNFFSIDTFAVYVNDLGNTGFGGEKTAEEIIEISVQSINDIPIPFDDSYVTNEDSTLTISVSNGILINDVENNVDNDVFGNLETLTSIIITQPTNGDILDFTNDGGFIYDPFQNWFGLDSFTYKVEDDSGAISTEVGIVNIQVNSVNDIPQTDTTGITSVYEVIEDDTLTIIIENGILADDSDVESELIVDIVEFPLYGVLDWEVDGSFKYIPNPNYWGDDFFAYKAVDEDGAASNRTEVLFEVTSVNDPPTNTSLPTFDGPVQINSLQFADPGIWDDYLDTQFYYSTAPPLSYEYQWERTADPTGTDYTIIEAWSTDDTYILQSTDNDKYLRVRVRATDTGIAFGEPLNLQTEAVSEYKLIINNQPIAVNDSYTINEDDTLIVTGTGVCSNDIDLDGDVLIATLVTDVSFGELTLDSLGSFTYYATEENWHGTDQFMYRVYDGSIYGNELDTVSITVNSVNDPPIFNINGEAVISVIEDGYSYESLTITPDASEIPTDEAGQVVSYSLSPDVVVFADVSIDTSSGKVTVSLVENGNTDEDGKVFKIIANDGGGDDNGGSEEYYQEFTLFITSVNDAPEFQLSTGSVNLDEDFSTPYFVTVSPSSIPYAETVQTVAYSIIPDPAIIPFTNIGFDENTGNVTLISTANGNTGLLSGSQQSFTITAQDNGGVENSGSDIASHSFTVAITQVNDPPVFTLSSNNIELNEDHQFTEIITVNPGAVPSDETTQNVIYGITPNVSELSEMIIDTLTGQVSFDLTADKYGIEQFLIIANDGSGGSESASQYLTLTINAVNDPPTIDAILDLNILEDSGTHIVNLSGITAGAENESQFLTISASSNNTSLIPNPLVNYFSPNSMGTLTFTILPDQSGDAVITVAIADNGGSNPGIDEITINFIVHVVGTNDSPQGFSDSYSTDEDMLLIVFPSQSVLLNDVDIDADPLTIPDSSYITVLPNYGELNMNSDGSFNYMPDPDYFGPDFFSYTATDGEYLTQPTTVVITVNSVNDAPEFTIEPNVLIINEDFSTIEFIDISTAGLVPSNEVNQAVIYTIVPSAVSFVDISINSLTGDLSIQAVENGNTGDLINETQVFTITAADDGETENNGIDQYSTEFSLVVHPVNDVPSFEFLPLSLEVNEEFPEPQFIAADPFTPPVDELNQTVTYSILPPEIDFVDVTINEYSGELGFTSITDGNTQNYPDSTYFIFIRAADNGGVEFDGVDADTVMFELTINPVNDAPVFTMEDSLVLDEDFYSSASITINPGYIPEDELGQEVIYSISPEVVEYTNVQINESTGTVTFTVVENGNTYDFPDSMQIFTVTAIDNGQTVFAGEDSYDYDFGLKIYPVNDPPTFTIFDTTLVEDFGETLVDLFPGYVPEDELNQLVQYSIFPNDIGIANVEINEFTGDLTLTPREDQYGDTTLIVIALDNGGTELGGIPADSAEFRLTIDNENDAPNILGPDSLIIAFEDENLLLYSISFTDIDAYDNDLTVGMSVAKGVMSLGNTNNLEFSIGSGVNDTLVEFTGTLQGLNSALQGLNYKGIENYNGSDTLKIIINDLGNTGLGEPQEETWDREIKINQINDAPVIHSVALLNVDNLPEDTSSVYFAVDFSDIDADTSGLNANPVSTDSLTWTFLKLPSEDQQRVWASEENDVFTIDSLLQDFNGETGMKVKVTDNGNGNTGEILSDTYNFLVTVEQRNDLPMNFDINPNLMDYALDPTSFFEALDSVYFRLPQDVNGNSKPIPEKLRFQWEKNDYLDVDTNPELNLGDSLELFYRLEMYTPGIQDSIIVVLRDSINHSNPDFDSVDYIFAEIDMTEEFSVYIDNYSDFSDSYENLDLSGDTPYRWRVTAQNYWTDAVGQDSVRQSNNVQSDFRIDLIPPEVSFMLMTNDMYPDYYDLFMLSDEFLDSAASFLYINDIWIGYSVRYMNDNLYHFTGVFADTGLVVYDFQARDLVRNLGRSQDSVNYFIATPGLASFMESPSGTALLHIPEGAVEFNTGIIISEKNPEEIDLAKTGTYPLTPVVHFQPEDIALQTTGSVRFDISGELTPEVNDWQYIIMKITEECAEELQTYYSRGTVSAVINELGSFAVFVDPNALVPLPEKFELGYNYPNPFNPQTIIPVAIPFESSLEIRIYNILGQEVEVLENTIKKPGFYKYKWNSVGGSGKNVSSGIYFLRVIYDGKIYLQKMMVLK